MLLGQIKVDYSDPISDLTLYVQQIHRLNLLETVVGEIPDMNPFLTSKELDIVLGLEMVAVGFRDGTEFYVGQQKKHSITVERSAYKHMMTED
jgi:hypothetical protein